MTGAGQGAAVRTPSSQAAFLLSQTRAGKMGAEVDRPNNAAVEISVEQAKLIAAWLVNLRERQIADISGTLESMGEYAKLEEAHAALLREVEGLKAALDTVRVELGALIVRPELRAHQSDIPMDLNEADRECVAKAFNAARDVYAAAPSPASGGV